MTRHNSILTWLLFFSTVVQLLNSCYGARILAFFPVPSKSHQFVTVPLLNELGKRGHEVVYYSALDGVKFHPNVTFMKLVWRGDHSDGDSPFFTEISQIASTRNFWTFGMSGIPELFKSQVVRDLLNSNEQFDVVLHESFLASEYVLTFVHKFQARSVALMSLGDTAWVNELAGLPDNPSFMVDWRGRLTDVMTFSERLVNTWNLMVSTAYNYYYLYQMDNLVREYARYPGWETRPHLKDLIADNALILVNSHHSVGYNFPTAPHVKEIGGIHLVPNETLPEDIAKFMDEATEGVVYFSMGSVVDTKRKSIMHLRNHLLNALGQLKIKALCKFHEDPSIHVPKNVKILPWLPQKDVMGEFIQDATIKNKERHDAERTFLAHKNLKIFISHGGLQSLFEATNYGVPVITIPFFADQLKNAKMVEKHGFGLHLDLRAITNTTLLAAINDILNNPRYKTEATRRSNLLKDRPMTPLNEAVYWMEYVLKHGNVLQPASVHLSFIQLRQIDILLFFILNLIAFFIIFKKILFHVKKGFETVIIGGKSRTKKNQ